MQRQRTAKKKYQRVKSIFSKHRFVNQMNVVALLDAYGMIKGLPKLYPFTRTIGVLLLASFL